ncbi:MAG: hypothetical protein OJF52_002063 [Nitrospira sp.]|nr:MAG: hypothetical protein OJF52_002063 [Nitrospira sp.]
MQDLTLILRNNQFIDPPTPEQAAEAMAAAKAAAAQRAKKRYDPTAAGSQ